MKIGITCYPTYGGSGVVATELGMALGRRGHEVHFITYSLPFRLQRADVNVCFHEVQVLTYPVFEHSPYAIALAAKMTEVARGAGLDLFHVHYAIPHAVSAYLARAALGARTPRIVTTLHGTDITLVGNDPSLYPITRFVLEQSDGVTCVSDYLDRITRETFALTRPPRVIPNFVDTRAFRRDGPGCLRERFAPHGERLLLHLSNFRPVKRLLDVVGIFHRVRQRMPARLLLVGDGQDRPAALHLAAELGLEKDVIFLGKQEDVAQLFCVADLFLLPSSEEAFGLAALEAISSGVPVIGSSIGGIPEVVGDGEAGLLFPVGDVEGMARGALALLEDEERMARARLAARARAVTLFDVDLIVPRYEAYYQEVLAGA
ncbi:MAG TPA: N-acetyl-alpha-D-glucosaminyl L-malate synthase BshA [Candidatus Sulfotelmatobacter sp.]|nr:N-acetyl-alpha-D-glucosaminyl L-malate synthase BshA [Candidatus Sulfotelmatobacter sp.]